MPSNLKRRVRARQAKTGESYSTALGNVRAAAPKEATTIYLVDNGGSYMSTHRLYGIEAPAHLPEEEIVRILSVTPPRRIYDSEEYNHRVVGVGRDFHALTGGSVKLQEFLAPRKFLQQTINGVFLHEGVERTGRSHDDQAEPSFTRYHTYEPMWTAAVASKTVFDWLLNEAWPKVEANKRGWWNKDEDPWALTIVQTEAANRARGWTLCVEDVPRIDTDWDDFLPMCRDIIAYAKEHPDHAFQTHAGPENDRIGWTAYTDAIPCPCAESTDTLLHCALCGGGGLGQGLGKVPGPASKPVRAWTIRLVDLATAMRQKRSMRGEDRIQFMMRSASLRQRVLAWILTEKRTLIADDGKTAESYDYDEKSDSSEDTGKTEASE